MLHCEINTRRTHDHPSQQSQTKEMMDAHKEKRSWSDTQQGQMSERKPYRCIGVDWDSDGQKKPNTHKHAHKSFTSGEERLQWFSKYDRRKNRGIEDMLKEIDPSVRTHSTFLSFRGRQTALGLTTVVITPLQHNCDSTVTRMNRLSSHSKYLLSGKLYIYPLHLFLIYTLYNLYLIIFSAIKA